MSENLLILISPSVLSQPRPQRYYVNGLNGGSIIIIILIRRQSGSAEAWKPRDGEGSSSFFNVFYDLGQIVWSMCTLHVSVTESGNSRQGREGRTIADTGYWWTAMCPALCRMIWFNPHTKQGTRITPILQMRKRKPRDSKLTELGGRGDRV